MGLYTNFQLCFARRQGRLAQWLTSTVANLNMTEGPKPQKTPENLEFLSSIPVEFSFCFFVGFCFIYLSELFLGVAISNYLFLTTILLPDPASFMSFMTVRLIVILSPYPEDGSLLGRIHRSGLRLINEKSLAYIKHTTLLI